MRVAGECRVVIARFIRSSAKSDYTAVHMNGMSWSKLPISCQADVDFELQRHIDSASDRCSCLKVGLIAMQPVHCKQMGCNTTRACYMYQASPLPRSLAFKPVSAKLLNRCQIQPVHQRRRVASHKVCAAQVASLLETQLDRL